MATTPIAGLASGFDWQSFITSVIQADSTPITNLQTQQTTLATQNADLTQVEGDMTTLQNDLTTLGDPSLFQQTSSSVSSSLWSASTDSTAVPGSHIIAVQQLASSSVVQGAGQIAQAVDPSGDPSQILISAMNLAQPITAGEFTVNGQRVAISTTDTLQDVFNNISAATGGTVTGSYNASTDSVTLTGVDPTSGQAVPVVLNSANDTSNFLSAMKLSNNGTNTVTSSARLGAISSSATLAQAGFATALTGQNSDGSGSFTINGATISYNATTDTLQSVLNKINSSAAGVTASYNTVQDRIVLTNNVTGNLGASVQDNTGNLAAALGITTASGATLVQGQDAQFTVDNGPTITSSSNTITGAVSGITGATITLGSADTQRVNISANTSSASTAIQQFVTDYNTLQSYLDQQTAISTSGTTVTTGDLSQDLDIKSLGESLRNQVFQTFSGGSGAISRLDSMGIGFTGTSSQLSITDPTALANALQNNSAAVSAFFTAPTDGFVAGLNNLVNAQIGITGAIPNEIAANNTNSADMTTQINTLQTNLNNEKTSMTNEFVQMENSEALLQSQLNTLNNALGQTSSSSSTSNTQSGAKVA